jgi:uncharacterized phage infection (PIP) family protein YhgE
MEILNILLDRLLNAPDNVQILPLPVLAVMALASSAASAAQGVSGIASGIIGGGKRQREQKEATDKLNKRIAEYEAFEFKNLYEDVENPAEDLRVGLQAAEFQAQQQQQGLAQTLDALRGAGGGAGAAALAQSLAQAQARSQQQIAAGIEQQELANERMAAQMEAQRQMAIAGGGMDVQQMELGRVETLTDMAAQEKMRADQARQQATQAITSGIGQLGGAAASFGSMGGFKDGGLDKFRMGSSAAGGGVTPLVYSQNIQTSPIVSPGKQPIIAPSYQIPLPK